MGRRAQESPDVTPIRLPPASLAAAASADLLALRPAIRTCRTEHRLLAHRLVLDHAEGALAIERRSPRPAPGRRRRTVRRRREEGVIEFLVLLLLREGVRDRQRAL